VGTDTDTFIHSVSDLNNGISRVAHRLLAIGEDTALASGTCVNLCTNLVLTAKHVLLDFEKRFGTEKYQLLVVQLTDDKRLYAIWECITGYALGEPSDLVVLNTRPYDEAAAALICENQLAQPLIRLSAPLVGDTVTAYGYSSTVSGTKVSANSLGGTHFDITDKPMVTRGVVKEIHPIRRDESMLNFSCYRVGFESRGGMSGGPVFDDRGRLCGIISTGWEDESMAYVSSLEKLPSIPIDLHGKTNNDRKRYRSIGEAIVGGHITTV